MVTAATYPSSQVIERAADSALAIRVQGLHKRFGRVTAVRDASFNVEPGDVFGLLGPNGAGKTTIIRMIVGLMKADEGTVSVFGFDPIRQRRDVLIRSSTILESPALYPKLSGYDNLIAMGYASGVTDRRKIDEVLAIIGLSDRAKHKFETYSLGMKQRLCVAASLLTDPQLIILDEPTNGLDAAGMRDIRELIRELAGQGRTVLLSSHLMNEVQMVCNRVAVLQKGSVIAEGKVDDLLAGQGLIRIRVTTDEIDRAKTVLEGSEWKAGLQLVGEVLEVRAKPDHGAALNRMLASSGIYAAEIVPEKLSLEEYYLGLTGDLPPKAKV